MAQQRRVTVRDVAARAGVAISTVSNVLNHPDRVDPPTQRRVLDAIRELGYVRNSAARELRLGSSRMLGLILLDAGSPFYWRLEHIAEEVAEAAGFSLLVGNSGLQPEREDRHLRTLRAHRASGLLVTPATPSVDRFRETNDLGTPVVLVDYPDSVEGLSVVSIDHLGAGKAIGGYLLGRGARSVAIAAPELPNFLIAARNQGVRDVIQSSSDGQVREFEVSGLDHAAGRQLAEAVLGSPQRPDAVFAPNDVMAASVVDTVRASGLRVPEDIAVIGYDDIGHASPSNDGLTTMHHDAAAIGRLAIDLLVRSVSEPVAPERHVFVPELFLRQTA